MVSTTRLRSSDHHDRHLQHRDDLSSQRGVNRLDVEECSSTGVPPQGLTCASYFYKKLHTQTSISSIVLSNMRFASFPHLFAFIEQGFLCRYIFISIYILVSLFREATVCGMQQFL
jgi:hypothetical protein